MISKLEGFNDRLDSDKVDIINIIKLNKKSEVPAFEDIIPLGLQTRNAVWPDLKNINDKRYADSIREKNLSVWLVDSGFDYDIKAELE